MNKSTDKNDAKQEKEKLGFGQRLLNGAQNIATKAIGLLGAAALSYYAMMALTAIALFFAKILFALTVVHALSTSRHFARFRHHMNELIIAPVRAVAYNAFIRAPMNGIINAWNAFCASHREMSPQEYADSTSQYGIPIFIQNVGTFTVNLGLGFLNAIGERIRNLGGIQTYPEATGDNYRASAMNSTAEKGSVISLGYEFIMGMGNWSSEVVTIAGKMAYDTFMGNRNRPPVETGASVTNPLPMVDAHVVITEEPHNPPINFSLKQVTAKQVTVTPAEAKLIEESAVQKDKNSNLSASV